MYVVCKEHLEQAIDEFIELYESPPDLYLLEQIHFSDWVAPKCCDFCSGAPIYLVV